MWGILIQPDSHILFYFGCNLAALLAFVRSLRVKRGDTPASVHFEIPKDAALRFGLTDREWDMVPLVAQGLANKEIAGKLGISPATVRTHLYNIFQKIGVQSRIELLNKLGS